MRCPHRRKYVKTDGICNAGDVYEDEVCARCGAERRVFFSSREDRINDNPSTATKWNGGRKKGEA